jgi:hypothetical protein
MQLHYDQLKDKIGTGIWVALGALMFVYMAGVVLYGIGLI